MRGGSPIDVPTPIELDATILKPGEPFQVALGQCGESSFHPLAGLWVQLSQRHAPSDGHCNLYAFSEMPETPKFPEPLRNEPVLTGFALVESIPS